MDDESVKTAREKYMDVLIALEEEEKVANDRKQTEEQEREKSFVYARAHILGLDKFLTSIFDEDPEFQRIFPIDQKSIMDQRDSDFVSKCNPIVEELIESALKRLADAKAEIEQLENCKQEAIGYHAKICIQLYNNYLHMKKQVQSSPF